MSVLQIKTDEILKTNRDEKIRNSQKKIRLKNVVQIFFVQKTRTKIYEGNIMMLETVDRIGIVAKRFDTFFFQLNILFII